MNSWPPRPSGADLREQLESVDGALRRLFRGRFGLVVVAATVVFWLGSGFYVVGPGERGVVLLFGRVVAQTEPGLRYRLPWPVQGHHVVDIATVRRVEIGFESAGGGTRPVPGESLMLTGDENIVDVQLFVQYLVQDPVRFLFGAVNPVRALHASAEVALRSAVGQNTIDYTMTEGRVDVQDRVKGALQGLLDLYHTGLLVTEARLLVVDPPKEVREAFHDVVRAWEDRERLIKEAEGYREEVVPRARGEAVQMVRAAEAYREQRLIRAQGDAARFQKLLEEYRKAEAVTRERLYLETVDRVLPKSQIFVLDGSQSSGVLPLLPLRDLVSTPTASPATIGVPPPSPAERR
jgi:membrane protease subunit HflK